MPFFFAAIEFSESVDDSVSISTVMYSTYRSAGMMKMTWGSAGLGWVGFGFVVPGLGWLSSKWIRSGIQ